MKHLTILHFSTNDFGGAGKAALRIHKAHLSAGWDSKLFVLNKKSKEKHVNKLEKKIFWIKKIFKKLIYTTLYKRKYLMYSVFDNDLLLRIPMIDKKVDLIFIHWVAGFVSIKDFKKLQEFFKAPIYWYLMDMAPITGGCHYSYGCFNYITNCSPCPAARIDLGFTKRLQTLKQRNRKIINYVSPNKWVSNQVKLLEEKDSKVAYIPIDQKIFKPSREKKYDKKIRILFGSQNLHDSRKGSKYFIKIMKELFILLSKKTNNFLIEVILPGKNITGDFKNIPFNIKLKKNAKTEKELAGLYQSSDLFVSCSLEDSGPMMVSEALMCGLPVFAFKTGICEEIISNGINGITTEIGDTKSLSEGLLKSIIDPEFLALMKINARKSAIELCSTKAHINQIQKILN